MKKTPIISISSLSPGAIQVKAPAKINLGLVVKYKRPDGYHELETVMQSIGLSDSLSFSFRDDGRTVLYSPGTDIPPAENLVWRAARCFREEAEKEGINNPREGLNIFLAKIIPTGAGLAGGSSDAAATLLALNELRGGIFPREKLLEMAAALGSDIPFCLIGGTVMAGGRGEKMLPWPDIPFMGVVLAAPPRLSILTREIYGALAGGIPQVEPRFDDLYRALQHKDKPALLRWMEQGRKNTLEAVAGQRYPETEQLKKEFRAMGLSPVMSGSGPAVFALTLDLKTAREGAAALYHRGYRAWASWTVNRLPALNRVSP